MKRFSFFFLLLSIFFSCVKKNDNPPAPVELFNVIGYSINGSGAPIQYNIGYIPVIKLYFTAAVNKSLVANNVSLLLNGATTIPVNFTYQNNDSTVILQPVAALAPISKYILSVTTNLQSVKSMNLQTAFAITFITKIDSTDKFPLLTDNQLLD